MAKSTKAQEQESKPSKFVAYNEEIYYGSQLNTGIETKNFTLNTRIILALQSLVLSNTISISVKKIIAVWIPLVEPGNPATIRISMSYLGGHNYEKGESDTILEVEGKMTEMHRVIIYPTHPVIKTPDKKLLFPWVLNLNSDEVMNERDGPPLGIIKVWCYIKMTMMSLVSITQHAMYKSPEITWENKHHPYYVPFYRIKKIRGVSPIIWRDTTQYLNFKHDIAKHVDHAIIPEEEHLMLMQTLSLEDANTITEMTRNCHTLQGGFCNCGETVSKFLSSALRNNNISYKGISKRYDDIAGSILTGKIRGMDATRNVMLE